MTMNKNQGRCHRMVSFHLINSLWSPHECVYQFQLFNLVQYLICIMHDRFPVVKLLKENMCVRAKCWMDVNYSDDNSTYIDLHTFLESFE